MPVVTWGGSLPCQRAGVSILTQLGLDEFIAADGRQYVELAVKWAADVPARNALAQSLRGRMRQSTLMDQARFVGNMEALLRRLWGRWCQMEKWKSAGDTA